ncbi:transposase [uncultured Sphaerochaeta sp.]|uniref:transposase n=1 Tax=uncultured Sphaerochaeta sp. TaxID=886478 RepID=UPI002A0A4112|nr:transposase [uncultured Sphaerochaeta sp.]
MGKQRKTFPSGFKAKIAMEALQSQKAVSQIAQGNNIHPNLVINWKSAFINAGKEGLKDKKDQNELSDNMLRKLGKQAVEIGFLKKVPGDAYTRARYIESGRFVL